MPASRGPRAFAELVRLTIQRHSPEELRETLLGVHHDELEPVILRRHFTRKLPLLEHVHLRLDALFASFKASSARVDSHALRANARSIAIGRELLRLMTQVHVPKIEAMMKLARLLQDHLPER